MDVLFCVSIHHKWQKSIGSSCSSALLILPHFLPPLLSLHLPPPNKHHHITLNAPHVSRRLPVGMDALVRCSLKNVFIGLLIWAHTRCSIYSSVIVDIWFFVYVCCEARSRRTSSEYGKHQLSSCIWGKNMCESVSVRRRIRLGVHELNSFGKQFYQCAPRQSSWQHSGRIAIGKADDATQYRRNVASHGISSLLCAGSSLLALISTDFSSIGWGASEHFEAKRPNRTCLIDKM